jgi:hypothetical protein
MKAAFWVVAIGFGAGVILGIWWLLWKLWTWVLPQLWASGPAALIAPGYWLFVGMLILLGIVGRILFGRSSKAD